VDGFFLLLVQACFFGKVGAEMGMKVLSMALMIVAAPIISYFQSATKPPEPVAVSVLKFSWSKELVGWQRDPFGGPVENFDEMRARARNEKRIQDAKQGNSAEVDRIKREARADAAIVATQHENSRSRYIFRYKVTVKNDSSKTIKSVDWDYVFLDASTETEINRQQFTSEEKISPGKIKELNIIVARSPTMAISVNALSKNERDGLNEQVVVMRIDYADGSVWQRP